MNNFNMVVTCDNNNIITINSEIPWLIPENICRLKILIKDGIIIMGRCTFEKIQYKNLKNSISIVLSRNKKYIEKCPYNNIYYANCKEAVYELLQKFNQNIKIYVIGGEQIYNLFIENTHKIYITEIYPAINNDNETETETQLQNFTKFNVNMSDFYLFDKSKILLTNNNELLYEYLIYSRINST